MEPEISLVPSPMLSVPRPDEWRPWEIGAFLVYAGGVVAHVFVLATTIGDAIEVLNSLCNDLAVTLKQILDLSTELLRLSVYRW